MIRRHLYRAAAALGDVHAVIKGKLPQRLARRVAYRQTNSFLRRLLRLVGL